MALASAGSNLGAADLHHVPRSEAGRACASELDLSPLPESVDTMTAQWMAGSAELLLDPRGAQKPRHLLTEPTELGTGLSVLLCPEPVPDPGCVDH
jgi:hypothetical protein